MSQNKEVQSKKTAQWIIEHLVRLPEVDTTVETTNESFHVDLYTFVLVQLSALVIGLPEDISKHLNQVLKTERENNHLQINVLFWMWCGLVAFTADIIEDKEKSELLITLYKKLVGLVSTFDQIWTKEETKGNLAKALLNTKSDEAFTFFEEKYTQWEAENKAKGKKLDQVFNAVQLFERTMIAFVTETFFVGSKDVEKFPQIVEEMLAPEKIKSNITKLRKEAHRMWGQQMLEVFKQVGDFSEKETWQMVYITFLNKAWRSYLDKVSHETEEEIALFNKLTGERNAFFDKITIHKTNERKFYAQLFERFSEKKSRS